MKIHHYLNYRNTIFIIFLLLIIPLTQCQNEIFNQLKKLSQDDSLDFIDFNFPSITDATTGVNQNNKTITVIVPVGIDKTSLIATFSHNAHSVEIASVPQISGTTANNFSSSVTYTLIKGAETENYTVSVTSATLVSIAITPSSYTLVSGRSRVLTAIGTFSDNSTQDITTLSTWTSSNGTAVFVDTIGIVSGLSNGTSTVSAQFNGITSNDSGDSASISVINDICVSPAGNDTTGDGCPAAPYFTINIAITEADSLGLSGVRVAEGTYLEQVAIIEGISLLGGWSDDFTNRDYVNQVTTIVAPLDRAIDIRSGVTSSTTISGFTINGRSNSIASTYGVFISYAAITIENNIINGGGEGGGVNGSTAIRMDNSKPSIIRNNKIHGGSGNYSTGIYLHAQTGDIYNNVFIGGTTSTSQSKCIHKALTSAPAYIRNNTFDLGHASVNYGIFSFDGNPDHLIIQNNIFFSTDTNGFAITNYSNPASVPYILENNNFFNIPNAIYYDQISSSMHTTITDMENLLQSYGKNASNNISVDVFGNFAGTSNFHLNASTPTAVKEGGIDGNSIWGFNTDKDGKSRTGDKGTGWTMGAYEVD